MKPKAVKSSREPCYPTRREVLAGAASVALANLMGCEILLGATEAGAITVAPIFEHGEGRGATGCDVVVPPAFLSEEEGMQIIREELEKHGIRLKAGGTWQSVRLPARTYEWMLVAKGDGKNELQESIIEEPGRAKPLKVDGVDSEKKIAVEFVSEKDYYDLGGLSRRGTVQEYDFKNVAQFVAQHVTKDGKEEVFFGTFYDPLAAKWIPTQDWRKQPEQGRDKSRELLRKQARDFVVWLTEQKAIK
jgi:hypothetical protein